MQKIPKQAFTDEFRELAVQRVQGGLSIPAAAKELGVSDQTLRNWVKAAAKGKLASAGKTVTQAEMELSRMRAELVRLERENALLKKAAAYFAREIL